MCSQPIEQDAQLLRATPRSSCSCSAASFGAPANVAAVKLRVGSVLTALKASRLASVPSSRYFAVAGPKLRARRSRAAARTAAGSCDGDLGAGLDQHGLDVLGPQHRAEAAAAGVPAVVADRRVPDAALPGRADRRGTPAAPEALPARRLGLGRGQAGQLRRRLQPDAVGVDQQHRQLVGAAADDDRVVAR